MCEPQKATGDAAHPMYPRGSNGAGQAILDARALADSFAAGGDVAGILRAYEDKRLQATANVVRTNRTTPPDVILKEVFERTGDRPFARLDDVISQDELAAMSNSYKKVAGDDKATVAARRSARGGQKGSAASRHFSMMASGHGCSPHGPIHGRWPP